MSKLKIFLLAAALVFIGTASQAQNLTKQPCSYEGKSYADGTTSPIGQVCVTGTWETTAQVQSARQCFYAGRAFSDGASNAEGKVCDGQTGSWK
jgi:hypothetical protein